MQIEGIKCDIFCAIAGLLPIVLFSSFSSKVVTHPSSLGAEIMKGTYKVVILVVMAATAAYFFVYKSSRFFGTDYMTACECMYVCMRVRARACVCVVLKDIL